MQSKWGRTLGVVFAVVVVVSCVLWVWGAWQLARAKEVYRKAYPQLLAELSESKARPANEKALELEKAAAALGLNWAPKTTRRFQELAGTIPKAAEERLSRVRPEFSRWAEEQIAASARERQGAPPEVAAFLREHQQELARLRGLLLEEPLPRWEEDVSAGAAAPIPNLLAALAVGRLLVAEALWKLEGNDLVTAEQDFLALRRLGEVYLQRSELISVMIGVAMTRLVVQGIRQVPAPDPGWVSWLEELDLAPHLERALATEAYTVALVCGPNPEMGGAALLLPPFRKAGCARAAEALVGFARAARQYRCLGQLGEDDWRSLLPGARWFEKGPFSGQYPNMRNAIERVQALHLHAALTYELLLARSGKKGPAPGSVVVDRGPCRGVALEVTQAGSSWSWRWKGEVLDLPKGYLPLEVSFP